MKKARYLPFAALFLLALTLFPLALLLMPRADFSVPERRYLARPPAFSFESGVWGRAVEDFVNDHLPLRNAALRLDAERRRLAGLNIMDSVWRLPGYGLAEAPVELRGSLLMRNLDRLRAFSRDSGLPVYLLVPPSAGSLAGRTAYYDYPDRQAEADFSNLAPEVTVIPLWDAFASSGSRLHYATDPHWNAQGAYLAYLGAAPFLGYAPRPESAFNIRESKGFLGTLYARSALWETAPDDLSLWDAREPLRLTLDREPQAYTSLFFEKHLEGADQYPVFLDGNHGLVRIVNEGMAEGRHLLVLKDSFANSLLPLLVPHYKSITAVDLRAFRTSGGGLADLGPFDQVLAVYSLGILSTDTNFPWLR